ncbi:MAG: methylmalonyl Co-A mutase-associated GTPase MeaB, partial [Vicinamibacteraceae bacterium]
MPPDARLPRTRLSVPAYIDGVRRGDRATLARAITLVESERAEDAAPAADLLDGILAHTGGARRIAVTGVPGAGKSTLIDALGVRLVREHGQRVAVLSIDPSSPVSGGSLLGDKTRMSRLAVEERAFVRPSPARGHLGGVAPRTREAILLCEAAGYDTVLVETVGVGQSEIAVREMTDCFVLLLLAGAGDEL